MKICKSLHVTNRKEWRIWLKNHHDKEKGIWLIYYKKHTGKPRILYEDAVEEALCYGWIDSIVKKIDDETYIHKFTPRKNTSKWSESNKKRVRKLIMENRMNQAGLAKIPLLNKNNNKPRGKSPIKDNFIVSADFKSALEKNKKALKNFGNFAPGYKKNYIRWIEDAKKQETREKRIREAVILISKNQKILMK